MNEKGAYDSSGCVGRLQSWCGMLVLHCLMLSQFFGDPLLFGSQFLRGGVRKLASSPQTLRVPIHTTILGYLRLMLPQSRLYTTRMRG
jgi:hypothetical protein